MAAQGVGAAASRRKRQRQQQGVAPRQRWRAGQHAGEAGQQHARDTGQRLVQCHVGWCKGRHSAARMHARGCRAASSGSDAATHLRCRSEEPRGQAPKRGRRMHMAGRRLRKKAGGMVRSSGGRCTVSLAAAVRDRAEVSRPCSGAAAAAAPALHMALQVNSTTHMPLAWQWSWPGAILRAAKCRRRHPS